MAELEQFLRHELTHLQQSLRALARESRTTDKSGLTDVSLHAAETLQLEMHVTLVDRRMQQVTQIQDALERLSNGQYGRCQDCEAFVGVARLRALPFAQRCRECQSQLEQWARREAPALIRELPRELEAA